VRELLRLLLLVIVVLPLTLILAGPLLVVAALRGSQAVGPLVLTPGHNRPSGRLVAFVIGLVIWVAVWGGTGLILTKTVPLPPTETASAVITPSPSLAASTPELTPAATAVPVVATEAPSPTIPSQPTDSSSQTAQPTMTPTPSSAASDVTSVPEPTAMPTLTPVPQPTETSPPPAAPVEPEEAANATAAIEQANELLRLAVAEPTEDRLAALESLWTENALAKAQEFAKGPSRMVGTPTEVSYAHLMAPIVEWSVIPEHLTVAVTEVWTYSGPNETYVESFEFFYTLAQQDGEWRIYNYTYIDAPQSVTDSGAPSRYRPPQEEAAP